MEKLTINVREMAEMLDISPVTAYEMVRIEGFPVIRVGRAGRRILIPVDALKEWLNSQKMTY